MKRFLIILLFPTLLMADIDRVNEEVSLPYWPDYILSGDPNELDEYLRILVSKLQELQEEIVTTVNLGVDLDDTDIRYFGTKGTDGTYSDGDWRIIKVGADDFEIQKKISGTWTLITKWTASGQDTTGTVEGDIITDGTATMTGGAVSATTVTGTTLTDGTFTTTAGAVSASTLTLSPLTAGSVLFAGTSGILSQDNAGIFWDSTNNYLGIGTATPTVALDINSDTMRIRTAKTPESGDATGAIGTFAWDTTYFYACVATNDWRRVAWSHWDALLLETGDYLLKEDGGRLSLE